jgi:hypothetical protein
MSIGAKTKQSSPSPAQRGSEDTTKERANNGSAHENAHPDADQ